ncbi:hypothetical protein CTRI78_v006525 [Colletotrichum trifolii]|uniref:Uncharacterized protein n=1 Tax=Colletotrichum trifolii TaxID=5466 RepID=A0A4R8RCA8_COLTR|nr:hypothetical protein CTRI78_v006525 [Colletotrichum trifolii]
MRPSQFLSAIALVASAGLVTANPVPNPLPELVDDDSSRLVARNDSDSDPDKCIKAPLSAEPDFSYYTFHIEASIKERAQRHGLTKIGVIQYCDSNGGLFGTQPMGTDNWAYAPLDKFGPDQPYKIKVNRCKKRYNRHVSKYQVYLCNEKNWCGTTRCGFTRKVCPPEKTKAVDLVDNESWICSL